MISPNINYYALMENITKDGQKTPKYSISKALGCYPPMEHLKGCDGQISMYLMASRSDKSSTPPMYLQAKGSLNFTGLKAYFIDGKVSGCSYGFPDHRPTFSSKGKVNPFFEFRDDGFLFKLHFEDELYLTMVDGRKIIIPKSIELIVLHGAKAVMPLYCKQLVIGGFDNDLAELRRQAIPL